jgi:hypothetical protein
MASVVASARARRQRGVICQNVPLASISIVAAMAFERPL